MPEELEPEMSVHKNVVRSSSEPYYTALHVYLGFNHSTNLIHSSKRTNNDFPVRYSRRLSMVTKALRLKFWKSGVWYIKFIFGTTSFELLTSHVVVDLILHGQLSTTTVGGLIFHRRAMPDESESEMSVHKIWCGIYTFPITRQCTSSFASNSLQTSQTPATVSWTKFALVTATAYQW